MRVCAESSDEAPTDNRMFIAFSVETNSGMASGVSAHRYVGVPQHIRFGFQIFQPMLDDIADADDADELAVGNRGQMPHAVMPHQARGALQGIVRGNCDCPRGTTS